MDGSRGTQPNFLVVTTRVDVLVKFFFNFCYVMNQSPTPISQPILASENRVRDPIGLLVLLLYNPIKICYLDHALFKG